MAAAAIAALLARFISIKDRPDHLLMLRSHIILNSNQRLKISIKIPSYNLGRSIFDMVWKWP